MKKRRDPNSLPVLTKKLDAVFSRWVRYSAVDDDGLCECYTCLKRNLPSKMNAGHYISRRHTATRWSEWNVHVQCIYCNKYLNGQPQEYRERLVRENGEKQVGEWEQIRHDIYQPSPDELKYAIELYTAKLKEIKALENEDGK